MKTNASASLAVALTMFLAVSAGANEYGKVTLKQQPAHVDDGLSSMPVYSPADAARRVSKQPKTREEFLARHMSSMGAVAAGVRPRYADAEDAAAVYAPGTSSPFVPLSPLSAIGGTDTIVHSMSAAGVQSETAIAANPGGTVLIAGYNDLRGLSVSPFSVSGIARSADGGATWSEVPVGPGGLGVLPSVTNGSVYGDPDVKWNPALNSGSGGFVYSSVYVRPGDGLQGMCIYTSDALGQNWNGPKQVTPTFTSGHAADKELIDVNQTTGRILMSWTDFGSTTDQIRTTFSDDGGTTWSTSFLIASAPSGAEVQGSVPRFNPGTTNANSIAYVIYKAAAASTEAHSIMGSRSTDGGATWSPPVTITPTTFAAPDQIQGVDRSETNPSMAVNYSNGDVYIVYASNNTKGTGDVAFVRELAGPLVTSAPKLINADPGNDRTQFFPSVAVDQGTGAVHVFYYDMGSRASGDVVEVSYSRSDDGGTTFTRPTPLNDRPMHAGYGNDTSQPNLGDYNQAVAYAGALHSLWGGTDKKPLFSDGQPALSLFGPDTYYDARLTSTNVLAVRAGVPLVTEPGCASGNGYIDPGETIDLAIPVENFTGNPNASATTFTGITATLSAATPGVSVLVADAMYPDLVPLATGTNFLPFELAIDPGFVPGTDIDLVLAVSSGGASIDLPLTLATGTPGTATALISENFSVGAPLPAGWSSARGGTTSTGSWATSQALTPGNSAAYVAESAGYKWLRLFSPIVVVPTPAAGVQSHVDVDFDITYNLEDEPTNDVQAYDGVTLRITDQTAGQTLRSVLAEAFATQITTETIDHFPKHLVRDNNTAYLEDMSVWSGNSNGTRHVQMRFPGEGMTGRSIQLRFEYAQDGSGICASGTCGAAIDNVVVNFVPATSDTCIKAASVALTSSANPSVSGQGVTLTANVAAVAAGAGTPTGTVEFEDGPNSLGIVPLDSNGVASLTTSTLSVGSHPIAASYSGDAEFSNVTGFLSQEVNKADTMTSVASSANPATFGQQITLTATVAAVAPGAGMPAGTVTFTDGASTIDTGIISGGMAFVTTSTLTVGNHTINATYNGDDVNFNGSAGPLSTNPQVVKAETTTSLQSSLNPSEPGAGVAFTATVSGGVSPTGTVTFSDGASSICTNVPLSGTTAICSTSTLAAGSHTVSAVYSGDGNNLTSSDSLSQVVKTTTSTTLSTICTTTFVENQSIALTAVVSGGSSPGGSVTFQDGATLFCDSVGLNSGNASCQMPALTVQGLGTSSVYQVTANYSGDGANEPSTSAPLTLTVLKANEVIFRNGFEANQPGCPTH